MTWFPHRGDLHDLEEKKKQTGLRSLGSYKEEQNDSVSLVQSLDVITKLMMINYCAAPKS